MFGVLNLEKPLHYTSHDVIARVRRKLGLKKVGHSGTLDPLATGVLPVFIGQATRLIEFMPDDKRYHAEITFGRATTTWDAEGETVQAHDASTITLETLLPLLDGFRGTISQQVPPHAAVHVQGKKLYEYARKGIAVELPVRSAEIHGLTVVSFQQDVPEAPVLSLDIHCASGTYIRSIAQALGQLTGTGAYLSRLVRTAHGRFTLSESIPLETFMDLPEPAQSLMNPADYIVLERFQLSPEQWERIRNGVKLESDELDALTIRNNRRYLLMADQYPAAIAVGEETGRLKPVKVFSHNTPAS